MNERASCDSEAEKWFWGVYVPRYARTSVACAGSIVNATPGVTYRTAW